MVTHDDEAAAEAGRVHRLVDGHLLVEETQPQPQTAPAFPAPAPVPAGAAGGRPRPPGPGAAPAPEPAPTAPARLRTPTWEPAAAPPTRLTASSAAGHGGRPARNRPRLPRPDTPRRRPRRRRTGPGSVEPARRAPGGPRPVRVIRPGLRRLRQQPLQALLAAVVVGGGTSLVVTILVLSASLTQSATEAARALAGPAPLRVLGPIQRRGITDADVAAIRSVDGVDAVVPLIQSITIVDPARATTTSCR